MSVYSARILMQKRVVMTAVANTDEEAIGWYRAQLERQEAELITVEHMERFDENGASVIRPLERSGHEKIAGYARGPSEDHD